MQQRHALRTAGARARVRRHRSLSRARAHSSTAVASAAASDSSRTPRAGVRPRRLEACRPHSCTSLPLTPARLAQSCAADGALRCRPSTTAARVGLFARESQPEATDLEFGRWRRSGCCTTRRARHSPPVQQRQECSVLSPSHTRAVVLSLLSSSATPPSRHRFEPRARFRFEHGHRPFGATPHSLPRVSLVRNRHGGRAGARCEGSEHQLDPNTLRLSPSECPWVSFVETAAWLPRLRTLDAERAYLLAVRPPGTGSS